MNRNRRAGLVVFGVLSLADVATLALTDGETPPYPVAILAAVLGIASLVLVWLAWRDPARPVRALVALRVVSALFAVPAFLVDDVPGPVLAGAAAGVVLTAVGVLLVARPARVPA